MDLDKVNALKQMGYDSFQMNKLDEAIRCYSDAIDLAGDSDKTVTAILYSNRAQTKLIQKKYAEALVDAEESLKYDPKFKKSILRRATANLELGNNQEAVKDLRKILLLEPKNSYVRSQMIRVSKSAQMSSRFSEAFIGHYLRRELTSSRVMQREEGSPLSASVLRISFVSLSYLPFLRQVFNNSVLMRKPSQPQTVLTLPNWFVLKRMKRDLKTVNVNMIMSNAMRNLIFPIHSRPTLLIHSSECAQNFGNLYNYSEVLYSHELAFFTPHVDPARIKDIQKSSQILTRLPYFHELIRLKDTNFPKLDTILSAGDLIIDKQFLKLWKKRDWGVKNLVFQDAIPNLSNFDRFDGPISNKLTTLYIPFGNTSNILFTSQIGQVEQELDIMKRVFPSLSDIVGSFVLQYPYSMYACILNNRLKSYIVDFATTIDESVKPSWCEKLKILVEFNGLYEANQSVQIDMQMLKRVVNECRREVQSLEFICLCGPSPIRFNWHLVSGTSLAMIKMGTKYAEFEIIFCLHPCEMPTSMQM